MSTLTLIRGTVLVLALGLAAEASATILFVEDFDGTGPFVGADPWCERVYGTKWDSPNGELLAFHADCCVSSSEAGTSGYGCNAVAGTGNPCCSPGTDPTSICSTTNCTTVATFEMLPSGAFLLQTENTYNALHRRATVDVKFLSNLTGGDHPGIYTVAPGAVPGGPNVLNLGGVEGFIISHPSGGNQVKIIVGGGDSECVSSNCSGAIGSIGSLDVPVGDKFNVDTTKFCTLQVESERIASGPKDTIRATVRVFGACLPTAPPPDVVMTFKTRSGWYNGQAARFEIAGLRANAGGAFLFDNFIAESLP